MAFVLLVAFSIPCIDLTALFADSERLLDILPPIESKI